MRIRGWWFVASEDDICTRGQLGNEPGALCQNDQNQDAAPGPEFPGAIRDAHDHQQQYQSDELGLVERSKYDTPNIQRNIIAERMLGLPR